MALGSRGHEKVGVVSVSQKNVESRCIKQVISCAFCTAGNDISASIDSNAHPLDSNASFGNRSPG